MDFRRDPYGDARDFVAAHFPQALWALLAGSVTTSARTAGSDLDIVVRLPDGDPVAGRSSHGWRGWPVEAFANDLRGHRYFLDLEADSRKPTLHRMIATGTPLGEVGEELAALRGECAKALAAGPGPLPAESRDWSRYGLSDILDDYVHSVDAGETVVIGVQLWLAAGRSALEFGGTWTGNGKWLLRELRALDADLAERWLAARDDRERLVGFAREVLDSAGGPLFEGYRRGAPKLD
ncbi:nucleotidyltransferase domain-containing protein [Phytomonospora sp. NPDC050363]|uniref:nucleotidyltransferase domain-containing protein n=1 Tax=Phytomonospora sp. NPDC050363 TaxID=3155642 RepID=UPI0033FBF176